MSSTLRALAALLTAALALVGPFVISMLMRWSETQEAANLAAEIGAAFPNS